MVTASHSPAARLTKRVQNTPHEHQQQKRSDKADFCAENGSEFADVSDGRIELAPGLRSIGPT
jgi:hypothetical protein